MSICFNSAIHEYFPLFCVLLLGGNLVKPLIDQHYLYNARGSFLDSIALKRNGAKKGLRQRVKKISTYKENRDLYLTTNTRL